MNDIILVVLGNNIFSGHRFRIGAGQNLVGRESGAAVRFHDDLVSRRHAMVTRTGDSLDIEDLGSANGTWVNDQPLVGRRSLRPGDVVRIGGLDVLVADDGTRMTRLMAAVPPHAVRHDPVHATDPIADTRRAVPTRAGPASGRSAFALSAQGLTINAVGSGVTALALSAFQVPQVGAVLGPAIAAVITAFVQTSGRRQWLRIVAAAGAAYLIAAAGITIPEIAIGRALADKESSSTYLPDQVVLERPRSTPGTTDPPTPTDPSDTTAENYPGIDAQPAFVDCGEVVIGGSAPCAEITIRSTGTAPLLIDRVDLDNTEEFAVNTGGCSGRELATDEECSMSIEFIPTGEGERTARIVIHQNIPVPDQGTPVDLTGIGLPASEGT